MSSITYGDFPLLLRDEVPGFAPVYDEHMSDYDEVLPHVLVGELTRFLFGQASDAALESALGLLERAAAASDERLQELVAVSFIENLEPNAARFPAMRKHFGPALQAQYRAYEEASNER